jgi:[NiFe] hydrogenase assembly HybE family chaperone
MRSSISVEAAHPGHILEKIYRKIHREHMLGLPILNPNLAVEAIGFVPFRGLWIGILITPWFMNLMILSGTVNCPELAEGESQSWQFPGGTLKFYAGFEAETGYCQVCSLVSPMREFVNQEQARVAAHAVLNELFTEIASVKPESVPVQTQPAGPLAEMRAAIAAPMTKRDFLRGNFLPGRQREHRG